MADGAIKRQGDSLAPQGVVFKALMTANQSLTSGTNTKINFNKVEFDPFGFYDTANSRFQPKIPGYYRISAAVYFHPVSGHHAIRLTKNGTSYAILHANGTGGGTDYHMPGGSTIVYLNGTTDHCQLDGHAVGSSPIAYGAGSNEQYSHWEGELLATSAGVAPEPWRTVGNAGEPAFQNGWTHYDTTTWGPCQFRKDPHGVVWIRGSVKNGSSGAAFTLPVGYRPSRHAAWPIPYGGGATSYLMVRTTGTVEILNGDANTVAWTPLDTISFAAEQ